MKNKFICVILATAALAAGCEKSVTSGVYDDEQKYVKAWLKLDHSDIGLDITTRDSESGLPATIGRGVYLLSETPGTGEVTAEKGKFVRINYISMDMDGSISSYTDKETAKKLGKFESPNYYGPHVITLAGGANYAGIIDAVSGMKIGGERTVFIPKWLMSTQDHETEDGFLSSSTTSSNTIYKIRLEEVIDDIQQYQVDKIEEYLKDNVIGKMKLDNGEFVTKVDTTGTIGPCRGFYFIPITDTTGHRTFPSDTTITINYTGSRLDGQVFDTTVERTAKDNDIWSSSRTYAAQSVSWAENVNEITMSSSTLITGFSKTLWQMNSGKGIGIFWSDLGYGSSGSGSTIPGYAPLMFEIEITGKEE